MLDEELYLRDQAVINAYRFQNIDLACTQEMELIEKKGVTKFYRFRPPQKHEISALDKGEIYLCLPSVFEDMEDSKWNFDIDSLLKYEVEERNKNKYDYCREVFTQEKIDEIKNNLLNKPRFIQFQDKVRNSCLVSCITDEMSDYMWIEYANNYKGACFEYDVEDVFKAIAKAGLYFFPVRYVDSRLSDSNLKFGVREFSDSAPPNNMINTHILSVLTKNKNPYSNESEWRVVCNQPDLKCGENGKLFPFIYPSKIYFGKYIDEDFKHEIEVIAKKHNIITDQSIDL